MYTVKVGLTDNEMKFLNQPPKLWNGNKERVRLVFEGPGIEKDANFAVRFSDGTEVAAPYGKCFVPGHLFNDYEFGFEAVTGPVAKRTNLLYSNTVTTTEYGDQGFYYFEDLNANLDEYALTDGNAYLVVFDGKEYLCKAQSMHVGGEWRFLGDMYIRFEDGNPNGGNPFESNDEPFCFYYYYNWGIDTREDGEHTVEVYEVEVTDETVSANSLTVELKPGEKGLYTLVEGVKDGEVLVDMDVSTTNGGGSSGMYHGPFEGFKPEVGKEYKVVFDGVEYTETAELFRGADYFGVEGIVSIGYDENIYCADSNGAAFPFVYLYMPDTNEAYVYASEWAEHHITIVEPYERPVPVVAKKLHEKVLPNVGVGGSGGGQFIINVEVFGYGEEEGDDVSYNSSYGTWNGDVVCDKTFDEVREAYENGLVPVVVVKQTWEDMEGFINHCVCNMTSICLLDGHPESWYFNFENCMADSDYINYTEVAIGTDWCSVELSGRSF